MFACSRYNETHLSEKVRYWLLYNLQIVIRVFQPLIGILQHRPEKHYSYRKKFASKNIVNDQFGIQLMVSVCGPTLPGFDIKMNRGPIKLAFCAKLFHHGERESLFRTCSDPLTIKIDSRDCRLFPKLVILWPCYG